MILAFVWIFVLLPFRPLFAVHRIDFLLSFVCCHTPESPPSVPASSPEAGMANSEGMFIDCRRNSVYLLPSSFRPVLNSVNYGQGEVRSRLPITRIISSLMFDPPVCQTRKGP